MRLSASEAMVRARIFTTLMLLAAASCALAARNKKKDAAEPPRPEVQEVGYLIGISARTLYPIVMHPRLKFCACAALETQAVCSSSEELRS